MRIDPRSLLAAAFVASMLLGGTAVVAAPASGTIGDDVRCLLLSTGFAHAAKDDATRRGLVMTGSFYLGRLSAHVGEPAVAAAIRAQGPGMRGEEAQPLMRACAVRAAAAEQQFGAIARQVQAKPAK